MSNLYVRYFDRDMLALSVEEVIDFLSTIPDIRITSELVSEVRAYAESDIPYPKRYKVRPRVYFILIKTNATTMAEFKANRRAGAPAAAENEAPTKKEIKTTQLAIENPGWYRGTITFKRVIQIPGTMKFQYQDTRFSAYVKAMSGQDCYNRIVHHLKNRQDVDLRSQFPSARGINFSFNYMGAELPPELLQANA